MTSLLKTWLPLSLALGLAAPAQANLQMAVQYGCLNCHGAALRGEAPSLERLSKRLSRLRGDAEAEARFVSKYQAGEIFGHIDAHERISDQSARTLVHWLVSEGEAR